MNSSDKDARENANVRVEHVIELACEMASKDLDAYWKDAYPDKEMYLADESGRYTELAQDNFNLLYDDIEGRIVETMETYPDKNIKDIEKHMGCNGGC